MGESFSFFPAQKCYDTSKSRRVVVGEMALIEAEVGRSKGLGGGRSGKNGL